jgi:hypothetical protein
MELLTKRLEASVRILDRSLLDEPGGRQQRPMKHCKHAASARDEDVEGDVEEQQARMLDKLA